MESIISLIPPSPDRISRSELSRLTGMHIRNVQRCITNARIDGAIVASDERGYFIPQSPQEVTAFYRVHRKRAITSLRSLRAVRSALTAAGVDLARVEGLKHGNQKEGA